MNTHIIPYYLHISYLLAIPRWHIGFDEHTIEVREQRYQDYSSDYQSTLMRR